MSDRVSIKGMGEDIFFEDRRSGQDVAQPEKAAEPTDALTRANRDTTVSRRQDVTTSARESAHKGSNERTDTDASAFFTALNPPRDVRRKLRAATREEHRFHTTIRLSAEDNNALRDVCYELEAKQGITATRNDVGRLGLRLLLEDYAIRKKQSLLVQILGEEEDDF